jgi:hypothetical protein
MKKVTLSIVLFATTLLLYSCGGVIGNIEKYRFNKTSLTALKTAVNKVYITHPEFKNFNTTKYKEREYIGDGDYYCKIKINEQTYFFQYTYPQYPSPNDTIVEIALTSAAQYGGDLNLEKDIGYFKKREYRKLFDKYFIKQVRKELKE